MRGRRKLVAAVTVLGLAMATSACLPSPEQPTGPLCSRSWLAQVERQIDLAERGGLTDVVERLEAQRSTCLGPSLSIADVGPTIQGLALDFTVTLRGTAAGPVTVHWATQDGTASSVQDVNWNFLSGSGQLTFAPGETSKGIRVGTINNTSCPHGTNKQFTVVLSDASGARIADGTATGTIAC